MKTMMKMKRMKMTRMMEKMKIKSRKIKEIEGELEIVSKESLKRMVINQIYLMKTHSMEMTMFTKVIELNHLQ